MKDQTTNKNIFEIDLEGLTAAEMRVIKTLNHLFVHILKTDNESEYFNTSAEAMRHCASLIKNASFVKNSNQHIPYAEQVIEYSLDVLNEHISNAKVIIYDN